MPYPIELSAVRRPNQVCLAKGRVFFSIFFKDNEGAFQRAAMQWETEIKFTESFIPSQDEFIRKEVIYEEDFKQAWHDIAFYSKMKNKTVWLGQLFTHASKQIDGKDGLEFVPSGLHRENLTLTQDEIIALPKMPWSDKFGCLILSGCNTGRRDERGWSPAQTFALTHKVLTLGQTGFAYFSNVWDSFSKIKPSDAKIFLWAYQHHRNGLGGSRMPAAIYFSP